VLFFCILQTISYHPNKSLPWNHMTKKSFHLINPSKLIFPYLIENKKIRNVQCTNHLLM
jgi:hypothetical protein